MQTFYSMKLYKWKIFIKKINRTEFKTTNITVKCYWKEKRERKYDYVVTFETYLFIRLRETIFKYQKMGVD